VPAVTDTWYRQLAHSQRLRRVDQALRALREWSLESVHRQIEQIAFRIGAPVFRVWTVGRAFFRVLRLMIHQGLGGGFQIIDLKSEMVDPRRRFALQGAGQDRQVQIAVGQVDGGQAVQPIGAVEHLHLKDVFIEFGELIGVARHDRQMLDFGSAHGGGLL